MFPFKFEIIDGINSYVDEFIASDPNNKGMFAGDSKKQLLSQKSTKILAFYTMYVVYSDKQSIVNHVRLHKMNHYNFKFEEGKKELMDNIPQILTTWTQFDDITEYFSKTFLGNDVVNTKEREIVFHKYILDYMKKNHPVHFVRKFFFKFYSIFYLF